MSTPDTEPPVEVPTEERRLRILEAEIRLLLAREGALIESDGWASTFLRLGECEVRL